MATTINPINQTFTGSHGVINKDINLFPPHEHIVWELILILEGTGYLEVDGTRYPFSPGTIFCIPPHKLHQNVPDVYYNDLCIGIKDYLLPGDQVSVFQDDEYRSFLGLMQL